MIKYYFVVLLLLPVYLSADDRIAMLQHQEHLDLTLPALPKTVNFKGWDYLVSRLYQNGGDLKKLTRIYTSPEMPRFTKVSFSLEPKEAKSIYKNFFSFKTIAKGRFFLKRYPTLLKKVEQEYNVPAELIVSIMLVETRLGENTGKEKIIYRLSRLANISAPQNLAYNLKRLKKDAPETTFQMVLKRAEYLEETFMPEILAAIEVAEKNKVDVFAIRGSRAGAFGLPQFLPSSYLNYAVDYNRDGRTSLFNISDATASIANYLKQHGWGKKDPEAVIWKYNKSQAYIDTVLGLMKKL